MNATEAIGRRFKWKSALDVITSFVMIGAAIAVVALMARNRPGPRRQALEVPEKPVSVAQAALLGAPTAPAAMIVYSDFECPFCQRFAREVLPEIQRSYVETGRLAVAFEHFPLAIHPHAMDAAASAECARKQDRFWQMHDALFGDGADLERIGLARLASAVGLDVSAFARCLEDESVAARIQDRSRVAVELGWPARPRS